MHEGTLSGTPSSKVVGILSIDIRSGDSKLLTISGIGVVLIDLVVQASLVKHGALWGRLIIVGFISN